MEHVNRLLFLRSSSIKYYLNLQNLQCVKPRTIIKFLFLARLATLITIEQCILILSFIALGFISSFTFISKLPGISSHSLSVDYISIRLIVLTLWLVLLILSARYHTYRRKRFFLVILILLFSLILRFSGGRIVMFYFYFEWSLIPTFLLVIGWGYQPERLRASLRLLFYTLFASLPLLLIIFVLMKTLFVFSFRGLPYCGKTVFQCSPLLMFIGRFAFMVKFPIYFVHLWLPKAHVEAPVSGSIILAGILLKLGGYGLLRLSPLMVINIISLPYCIIALWGGSILRVMCLRHRDIKVLIAYSSVVHIALVIAGILSSNRWGIEGRIIIMIAHGACSSGIFAQANIMYERRHSRRLMLNKGYLNLIPLMRLIWFILIVGNFGGPFTLNLVGEILLILSVINVSFIFWPAVSFLRFFSAAYSLILYRSTQQGVSSRSVITFPCLSFRELLLVFRHSWLFLLLTVSPMIT